MTHEEAIEAAVQAYWARFTMDDDYSRKEIEAAIAAYLEARGAVLCSATPVGYTTTDNIKHLNEGKGGILRLTNSPFREDDVSVPLHVALSVEKQPE